MQTRQSLVRRRRKVRRPKAKPRALPQPTHHRQIKSAVGDGSKHLEQCQTSRKRAWVPPSSLELCLAVRRPVYLSKNRYHSGIPVKPGYCGIMSSVHDRMHDVKMIKIFWARTLYVRLDHWKYSKWFRRVSSKWFTPRARVPPEHVLRWFAGIATMQPYRVRTALGCTFKKFCTTPTKDIWELYSSGASPSIYLNSKVGLTSLVKPRGSSFADVGTRLLRRTELARFKESSGNQFASFASNCGVYFLNRHETKLLDNLEIRSKASLCDTTRVVLTKILVVSDCGPELEIQEGHSNFYLLSPSERDSSSEEESDESDSYW